ncbi:glycosyltransferase [Aequorivita echinoideorum]|nr:glycosyltransferase family 4 protein [Aequorivita echinoideorum]
MMQLIDLFLAENFEITFASTATISERTADLNLKNISLKNILLNDASFDDFLKELKPKTVIFDRYITEEQFGWRVSEICPDAVKILDTEDLHFLRKAREEAVKNNIPVENANIFSENAKREIASILRCDLSLIISEVEMHLLQNTFKISSEILHYLPFLAENVSEKMALPTFGERKNFMAIGNLLHAPNVDAVMQLKEIWPAIKKALPTAELHIYGTYAPQKILQLQNSKEGFYIKGWAENVSDVMKTYRVQLAPLRFGAGLKGKFFDAMRLGLPSVTTEIGAEGMTLNSSFGGIVAELKEDFIESAVQLYSNENLWNSSQAMGFDIIQKKFLKENYSENFSVKIKWLQKNLKLYRNQNFLGQVLQHHTLQSTKYLSKWIEEKNRAINNE